MVFGEVQALEALMREGVPVAVSIAPSFPAHFGRERSRLLPGALFSLGAKFVEPTNIVLEDVVQLRLKERNERLEKPVISSCCPQVVKLLEKEFAALSHYLSEVPSPAVLHAQKFRERLGHHTVVLFCSPCPHKKEEARRKKEEGAADLVLTFEELENWLEERGAWKKARPVSFSAAPSPWTYACVLFDGISGLAACRRFLREVRLIPGGYYELLACEGGCLGGMGMNRCYDLAEKKRLVEEYARHLAACPGE